MRPIVVWFRRDLRTDDHAALYHAVREHTPLIPLFIFDDSLIRLLRSDGSAFNFQRDALVELSRRIGTLGGRLIVRRGDAMQVHESLIREMNPAALYYNRDYEPGALDRDGSVEELYRRNGALVHSFKDSVVHEPREVLTGKGEPYVVFTPYANAWRKLPHPLPYGKPRPFSTPPAAGVPVLGASDFKRLVSVTEPIAVGGEEQALRRWHRFLTKGILTYSRDRDFPALDGTSRMSVHLRFGCISVRRILEDCSAESRASSRIPGLSLTKFIDELIWREFYQSVLFNFPRLVDSSYRSALDAMSWKKGRKAFEAWKSGETGFPLVDAGMRQLNKTGWMHNRVRMVVASFLSKDLRMDWRRGAEYFETKLIDCETASNIGGWQWSASAGVDPKPLRIFNPRLQSERFDPSGVYIRKFLPELCNVPNAYIHAPHLMTSAQQREAGCVIGKDYPKPIVDHAAAAAEFRQIVQSFKPARPEKEGATLSRRPRN